jgi:hypothetical protein
MTATLFSLMAREFPDYDQSTLPVIPHYWMDTSWHNDVCPSFTATPAALDGTGVHVYCDYADATARQFDECSRFSAYLQNEAGVRIIEIYGDDWGAILRGVFSMLNEWDAILALNASRFVQTFPALCDEFKQWTVDNDRPEGDATDNLFDPANTPEQQAWLLDFNERWSAMEDAVNAMKGALARDQQELLTAETRDAMAASIARIEEGR